MSCWGWSPDISVPKISYRAQTKKHQVYDHLPPITKTINFRQTRNAWHCWRSKDELISDVLLWNPSHGRAMAWRLAGTYIKQLCAYTGRSHEDQPEAMYDRERWRERVMDIRAEGATWRWLLSVCLMLSISSISNLLQFSCFFSGWSSSIPFDVSLFRLSIIAMAYSSLSYSIPESWLYILIVCVMVSSSFSHL